MNFNELYKKTLTMRIAALLLALISLTISMPVYAWFAKQHELAAYAPVSSPEALYLGAGHTDLENNQFEDIRYMYFTGLDLTNGIRYDYRVFCVYGKAVEGYKLQLAYTTNNQFTYELFHAYESESEGSVVSYLTHSSTPTTYYYSLAYVSSANPLTVAAPTNENPASSAIAGTYLNKQTVGGEDLASGSLHSDTYGEYTKVNKYAEPIYWQTTSAIAGSLRGSFVHYYIIRVDKGSKAVNDRETDILCIAAKSAQFSAETP